MQKTWLTVLACAVLVPGFADLTLPAQYSDHMVLQCAEHVPIRGFAEPGKLITLKMHDRRLKTTASKDGAFEFVLNLSKFPEGPHELRVSDGTETRTIRDILIGEVWLCGGQSNMAFYLRHADEGKQAARSAANFRLRFFESAKKTADTPCRDQPGGWQVAAPAMALNLSAISYFFGAELQKERNTPVGILHISWGGTPIEAWMARETLDTLPEKIRKKRVESPIAAFAKYRAKPSHAMSPPRRIHMEAKQLPAALFNARIAPLEGFAIRGVLFYQGESNASSYAMYGEELRAFFRDWRRNFRVPDMPFLLCLLPEYKEKQELPVDMTEWVGIRAAQISVCDDKTVFPVNLLGLGSAATIHPSRKREAGVRAAKLALKEIYCQREIAARGPEITRLEKTSEGIRVFSVTYYSQPLPCPHCRPGSKLLRPGKCRFTAYPPAS